MRSTCRRRRAVCLLLGVTTLSGCASLPRATTSAEADDAAVYATVLDSRFGGEGVGVAARTAYQYPDTTDVGAARLAQSPDGPRDLLPETAADFNLRNREHIAVPRSLPTRRVQARVVPELASGPRAEGLPPSAAVLSRVGYSRDRRQALVYLVITCHGLCAYGAYVTLARRPDGTWEERHTWTAWWNTRTDGHGRG